MVGLAGWAGYTGSFRSCVAMLASSGTHGAFSPSPELRPRRQPGIEEPS